MKYFKLYIGYLLVKKLRIVFFNLKNHYYYRNSQSCVYLIGCSTNWGKAVEKSFFKKRSYIRGSVPNLNRLNRARKHLAFSLINIRAILSRVYVQLDARPIKKEL